MSWTGDQIAAMLGTQLVGMGQLRSLPLPFTLPARFFTHPARSLIDGAAHAHAPVDTLIRPAADADPADLHDPTLCPVWLLPLVAAEAGIVVPPTDYADDAAPARARIVAGTQRRRGSPESIIAEIRPLLTGSQTVRYTERFGGNPDLIRIETYEVESPPAAVVRAAALRRKPVGLLLQVDVISGQTWEDLRFTAQTWGGLRDSGQTWDDVRNTII